MSSLSENKEIVKLEKKLRNQTGGFDYVDDLRRLSKYDLESKLKDLAKHKQAIITTKRKDEKLIEAKKEVSNLNAPYNEQTKGNDEKSRFIGLLIQEIEGESEAMGE